MRKKRDTSKKRDAIIAAAVLVFGEVGYENASMDIIAERGGASKKTLYNHFSSKHNLFLSVLKWYQEQTKAIRFIPYSANIPIKEQLKSFGKAELELVGTPEFLGISRLLATAFIQNNEIATDVKKLYLGYGDPFEKWIIEAVKDGKIVCENSALTGRIFGAMLEGALSWPAMVQFEKISEEVTDTIIDEIVETFICRFGVR